jgi:hypothetical protein
MEDWTKSLIKRGDPVEKEGCQDYQLHEKFPRYAEVWGRYVLESRDPNDPWKLRDGFPVELEDLFNHHYGVWYHLVVAHRQIEALGQSNPLIDIGDPLFHLATATELTERVFVIALKIRRGLDGTEGFWKNYSKSFEKWAKRFKSKEFRLHSVSDLFDKYAEPPPKVEDFKRVSKKIGHYRNALIHNLPPLRIVEKEPGKVRIPKEKFLSKYAAARWSSGRFKYDPKEYELAETVIRNLANEFVECINELWETLLAIIKEIASSDYYERWFHPEKKHLYDGIYEIDGCDIEINSDIGMPSRGTPYTQQHPTNNDTGGSIDGWSKKIHDPTNKPSAYNDDKGGR